jgi:TonB family protein
VETEPVPEQEDPGRVLTGSSDDTIPIPEAKAGSHETEPQEAPTSGASAGSEPSGQTQGYADTGTGSSTATEAAEEGAEEDKEAEPPKPLGHEFGKGESLVVNSVPPRYPKDAQNVDLIGIVGLEVTVDKDGEVISVDVSGPSGYYELDEQARRTIINLWRFKGINWPYNIRVTVSFKGETEVDVTFGGVTVLDN